MMATQRITILPARGCRRSQRLLTYLRAQQIPFTEIALESPEGQALTTEYDLRASPGILVNGVSINPFDLLIQPACRVDDDKARAVFAG